MSIGLQPDRVVESLANENVNCFTTSHAGGDLLLFFDRNCPGLNTLLKEHPDHFGILFSRETIHEIDWL